ncbi:MAG: hypothetical protein BECKG1743D_GA0114223_111151 [Candidatus Kentron sp. G]|nr:MAG: hypothetical protein BECKG1743F_GA0114225_110911 [Candidatus Kentron sp. G]VFN06999.1 MAG: hypothetical protein BECKG1743E_GA0114224_111071 [Candidatus Kentron sp. G]VFN07639.1 MAG: hypothetical protein BECKG1743D_GA0114223_111151 [Candidatus Kentron sp. G]
MKKNALLLTLLLLTIAGCAGSGASSYTSARLQASGLDTRERFAEPEARDTQGRQNGIEYRITGQENEVFAITFTYFPERETDPDAVIATDLTVTGGGNAHTPTVIERGTILHRYTGVTQTFQRTDSGTDISIRLDLQGREGVEIRVTDRTQDRLPLGTIVQSILAWPEYVKAMNDKLAFDPKINLWAPCDKRDITGSDLAALSKRTEAPDLRGVFLRGMNQFDPEEPGAVSGKRRDPGPREADGFQHDNVGTHRHVLETTTRAPPKPEHYTPSSTNIPVIRKAFLPYRSTKYPIDNNRPGGETRPNNVAVHYYIKINQ